MSSGDLNRLELELRRLPGVAGVGFTEDEDVLCVHVEANATSGIAALRRQVVLHSRASIDRAVVVDIHESDAAVADRGRVKLVAVRIERFSQEMEVHLAHRGVHTVGRGSAGSPTDAVDATMQALVDLGAELPFKVEAASAPVSNEAEQAVIVILEPEDDGSGTRYGVARGSTIEEAAARATLHALNRYLSRGPALSSAS
jgi:hypothetical protein